MTLQEGFLLLGELFGALNLFVVVSRPGAFTDVLALSLGARFIADNKRPTAPPQNITQEQLEAICNTEYGTIVVSDATLKVLQAALKSGIEAGTCWATPWMAELIDKIKKLANVK